MPRSAGSNYQIDEITIAELNDDTLAPIVDGVNQIRAELYPRYTGLSVEEFRIFTEQPGEVRQHRLARAPERKPAGFLSLSYPDDGTTPRLLRASIAVLPEYRRRGLATRLLEVAVETARHLGREILAGVVYDTVPAGDAFARAAGASKTLDFHSNTVRIDDLDRDMLGTWLLEGPERAPGYSVRIFEGMYPDEILGGMAHLYHVLERDMPHPDTWEPRNFTPELVRDWVGNFLQGVDLITAVAFEDASDTPAGMSQLGRRHRDQTTWFVTTTMVDPAHRGHALGKWVKAASTLGALERWPRAEWMETGNAFTNEAMLGINREMGFAHEYTMSHVEVEVDDAEAYLATRSH